MASSFIAIAVLFPFVAGLICLFLKHNLLRSGLVALSAVVLISSSILLFSQGDLPIEYSPAHQWDSIIMVLDYALLAFFLLVGVKDIIKNGWSVRGILTTSLVLSQIVLLGLFEFVWAPAVPLPSEPAFFIDQLSIIMCLIISIIGSLILLYAIKYMKDHEHHQHLKITRQPRFFFFMTILLGAMNGIVFSDNLLWIYFFWEITTLCCFALIGHEQTKEAVNNAFRALWMNLIGGLGFVLAIIYVFTNYGSISLQALITNPIIAMAPLFFLFMAAFTKAAQVPFQGWLLGAMVAPVPVSALLHSSTMVKAGIYLSIRLAPAITDTTLATLIALFGAFTFMVTALMAISQRESKKVLAYSTISNLGLIIMCVGINTPLAITAAIVLTIFHAISKALLFMCVGVIDHSMGSRDIEDMEGLVRRYPLIAGITVAGILSMMLVPFGMLLGKWAAIEATSAMSGFISPLVFILLVIGSAATTVFWVKWLGRFFSVTPGIEKIRFERFSFLYHSPLIVLLALAGIFSLAVIPFYENFILPAVTAFYPNVVDTSTGFFGSAVGLFTAWPLFILLAVALILVPILFKPKAKNLSTAYMCGENVSTSADSFYSVADGETKIKLGSMYLDTQFANPNLDTGLKIVGLLILVSMLVVVLI
ncbi:oxidoreductase [Dehalococcoides mccartyi]|nr:proton-conducting transporter membrane subunit [Dehalococcoides mccartyi]AGG07870.1 energy converting NiFe hydrogenase Na+/H+ pump subunit EchA [Dehalococcoides mccartyi BTF08]KSV17070.1 oxidoreductase [Dehalococcoides mccartyi]